MPVLQMEKLCCHFFSTFELIFFLLSSQRISLIIISSLCDFFIFSMSSRKLSTVWKQENTTMIVKKEDVSNPSNYIIILIQLSRCYEASSQTCVQFVSR